MNKSSTSYNWQKFIDDQPINEVNADDNELLLEMRQEILDRLSSEIAKAESGEYAGMPFNDIFGEPTEGSPKTRMIMPYGNPDIHKMKIFMLDIFDNLLKEYNANPNIKYVKGIVWSNKKEQVTQKLKPQGWTEGDPIKEVTKETGSPYIAITYISKMGEGKEREVVMPFGKLFQKYFPKEMAWWQGDKAKGISGKQSFFTSNVETMDNIIHEVKFGDENEIRKETTTDKIIIVSRHPTDVVRMSDFEALEYSCHSQKGSHFKCAVEEAKRTAGGGAVLFMVNKAKFEEKFPDGVIPQTGDLFNDRERGINDKFDAQATARLRLRKVVNLGGSRFSPLSTEYAIPDRRIYGKGPDAFRQATLAYFANRQLDKFVDAETGELKIPRYGNLERYGGSYEDSGTDSIGNNFISLMTTAFTQAGISEEDVDTNEQFLLLNDRLEKDSINWEGDFNEEGMNITDDDAHEEEQREYDEVIRRARNRLDYIEIEVPDYDIEDNFLRVSVSARVSMVFPKTMFSTTSIGAIKRAFDLADYDDHEGDVSLKYPDMELDFISVVDYGPDMKIDCVYAGNPHSPSQLSRWMDDLVTFEGRLSIEDYKSEIEAILDKADIFGKVEYSEAVAKVLSQIEDELEDSGFELNSGTNRKLKKYTYIFDIMEFPLKSEADAPLLLRSFHTVENEKLKGDFSDLFGDLFNQKAVTNLAASIRQQSLFKDMKIPNNVSESYDIALTLTKFSKDYQQSNDFVSATASFNVFLDATLSEEEKLMNAMFLNNMIQSTETIKDIAHKAFVRTYKSYLSEQRSTPFDKLIKEWRAKKILK